MLVDKFESYGGKIQFKSQVESIETHGNKSVGVKLSDQTVLTCDNIISTVGSPGTAKLLGNAPENSFPAGKMSFVESIYILPYEDMTSVKHDHTIIFYSLADKFDYCRPERAVDPNWGVICFPQNFKDLPSSDYSQIRITNSANYDMWRNASSNEYKKLKKQWGDKSCQVVEEIIGNFRKNIVYEDSFTPVTIEKYTAKENGAVYGSPIKVKDGKTAFDNLFIAGTDQGYLGIIGSMLSGITIVNHNLLANN
jgi:phytoene dehydrogenase-like protein